MASLRRVPVAWTTGVGGAGLSVFYTDFGDDVTTELGTFFNAVKSGYPGVVTWSIPSAGDEIDEGSGIITGAWIGGTAATITATGGNAAYVAGTGLFIRWITGAVVSGRKVRGRTFMCPLLADQFDVAGTINNTTVSTHQTAAGVLATSGKLRIWHRPPIGTTSGSGETVTAAVVPDKVTSLRSRRT